MINNDDEMLVFSTTSIRMKLRLELSRNENYESSAAVQCCSTRTVKHAVG